MGVRAPVSSSGTNHAHRLRLLLLELIWLLGSALLAAVLLYYLHEAWQPWTALAAGFLGGVLLRFLLRSNFARFPGFLRLNFEIGVALLGVLLASWATLALYSAPYWILKWRPAVALPVIAALLGLALAALRTQQARFERSVAELRDRENALHEETLRSQLRALQAQINPHFLFNSLNALAELTHADAAAAETMVQDLSQLLRYSLRSSSRDRVPLSQELDAVERYLRIEKTRLGDRLRVEREIETGLEDLPVPGLILQPLVENAVRHAVLPRPEGGTLRMEARYEGTRLLLVVEDDGPGLPAEARRRLAEGWEPALPLAGRDSARERGAKRILDASEPGIDEVRGSEGAGGGLTNVRQRLNLAYRGEASLSFREAAGGGSRFELLLPVIEDRGTP